MRKVRHHFSPGTYDLRRKRSRTGLGLFTFTRIPKNACIIEYTGIPVDEERGRYVFQTGPGTLIDGNIPSNLAKYINHSCAPNCEIDIRWRRVFVFAKRTIKAGEELTYDYDEEYFDVHIKPRGCRCAKCDPV